MTDKREEVIDCLEKSIEFVREHGAEKVIIIIKNEKGVASGWVEMDTYNFSGMMASAAIKLSSKIGEEADGPEAIDTTAQA